MTDIENRLNLLQTDIRRTDPAYAGIAATKTIEASDIQALLDDDTVLLQYALADARSFGWAVTRESLTGVELASRGVVQQASLAALGKLNTLEPGATARRELEQALQALAALVLQPFASQLDGKKRILVVPDGVLEYLPFGVLPHGNAGIRRRLIDEREVVVLPSLSVVAALRGRQGVAPEKTIAVFADPVVGGRDPRLGVLAAQTADDEAALARLPSTADEANAIAALVPETDRYVALGFEANREQVMSMELADYRFVHFATHGTANTNYPALSSLVLSRFDAQGQHREGELRLYDVFDLELNATLVALSACNTALGGQIRGEGLIGLAQGFMYAGARSMLVSLWQVPDRATAELMTRFYRHMLDPQHPRKPAEALRMAQMALSENPRWRHPFFWGAFVLLGDWQ
jgi:CHAT domain-containing protein